MQRFDKRYEKYYKVIVCYISLLRNGITLFEASEDCSCFPEVKVNRNGPERRSGKRIVAGAAFRLEFLVGWYYDADATMVVPELY